MAGATLQPDQGRGGRLVAPGETVASIGATVGGIPLDHPANRRWWIGFAGALALLSVFAAALAWLLLEGVGVWNNNTPVVWALDIASYDWWIGIASGSLLVSGILLLTGAEWRCAVNRIAETVALLATCAAGLYPIVHLGRPWFFYWNLPYPNTFDLYPQFRSPLVWDATNIIAFLTVALSLWYIGLLPDLAALRDRAFERAQAIDPERSPARSFALLRAQAYGLFAAGWRGSATHWQRWLQAYRTIALLGCLLVVCVQAGASIMLAGSLLPGWHDTMLPVTFLVGAVLSGTGFTGAVAVAIRRLYGLEALITERHLDILARMLLVLGLVSFYCHAAEFFSTFLHGDAFDRAAMVRRIGGAHGWALWTFVLCSVLPVQIFWLPAARRSALLLGLVGLLTAAGIYADHVMVLVVSLQHDFLPSSAQRYAVGIWDILTFLGSVGLFLVLLMLFLRYLPTVSIAEMRRFVLTGDGTIDTRDMPRDPADTGSEAKDAPPDAPPDAPLWGLGVEFASEKALVVAARRLSEHDPDVHLDAHGPVPMPGAATAIHGPERSIRDYALVGALAGGFGFLGLCIWCTVFLYPLDIGGRPTLSWPSFVIPSCAVAMMTGTLAIHLALLVLNRLPRLNHPAFNIPGFLRATHDRFFLSAEARSERFNAARIERRLMALPADDGRPLAIVRVPR